MKKLFVSISLILIFVSVGAQQNLIKLNPVAILSGEFGATYERILNRSQSLSLHAGYVDNFEWIGVDDDLNSSGMILGLSYRYYLSRNRIETPSGVFVSPMLFYYHNVKPTFGINMATSNPEFQTLNPALVFGYQYEWHNLFFVDFSLGGMYGVRERYGLSSGNLTYSKGLLPYMSFGVGYSF